MNASVPLLANCRILSCVLVLFGVCLSTSARDPERTSLGEFSRDVDGWTYYGGVEFPGATGSLALSSTEKKSGPNSLELSGDFTKGGLYVAAKKKLSSVKMTGLHFWVKRESGEAVLGLDITDTTGQGHHKQVTLNESQDWQEVTINNIADGTPAWLHSGGANDGKFHQPANGMGFSIGKGKGKTARLYFDRVEAVFAGIDTPRAALKSPPPPVPAPPLPLSCTTEAAIPKWKADGHLSKDLELRNNISFQARAFEAKGALLVEVTHPRILQEHLTYALDKAEDGKVWAGRGYDHLSFWYRTDDAEGEVYLLLKGAGGEFASRVTVRPGQWTRVVLPFAGFYSTTYAPARPYKTMAGPVGVNSIRILSDANSLRAAGKILLADFEVSAFARPDSIRQTDFSPISVMGPWKGIDAQDDAATAAGEAFDDAKWSEVMADAKWSSLGTGAASAAWLRAKVFVPKEWEGTPLVLTSLEGANCTVWWNGSAVDSGAFPIPVLPNCIIPADRIHWGAVNTLAVRVARDKSKSADEQQVIGDMSIEPKLCVMTLRPPGGTPEQERLPARFDMGAQPPESVELVFRFPERLLRDKTGQVSFNITDYSFHSLALGETPLSVGKDGRVEAVVRLGKEETRKLYYSEYFEYQVSVRNKDGSIPTAETVRVTDLCYAGRDAKALAPLPETWEETSYGRLKLVDDIDCSADPSTEGHPYKEGGITWDRWVLRKYYYFWKDGISVENILGRKSRVASNSSWFGYRIGRNLRPGQTYVLRVEYPEDKPRYVPMDIALGDNYSTPGFKTGVSPNDPFDNFPLSGKYEHFDTIVVPDDFGYGYRLQWRNGGFRSHKSVPSVNGFWVNFIDVGGHFRHYATSQFAGPAVSRIRLYEIDPTRNAPRITTPNGLPERIMMTTWEHEPSCDPLATAQTAKLMGWNAISPETLKWGGPGGAGRAYWPTKLGLQQEDPAVPFVPLPKDKTMNTYEGFLKAAQKTGIYLIPRLEYGGSNDLPKEARCVGPNGVPAPMARYATWGADLLHPETLKDYERVIDEVVTPYLAQYPCLKKGILWRMRCGRMTISYSAYDVELFCKESNLPVPPGDPKALALWASSGDIGQQYEIWWQKKRMEFNLKVRDKLRSIDPGMKLFYYNWDQDGWALGRVLPATHQEWALLYDNENKGWLYEKELAYYATLKHSDFVKMVRDMNPSIQKAVTENYRNVDGVAFSAPVCLRYVADNPEYLDYFRTGDGLAVDHQVLYEETIAYYAQHNFFEGSMMTPAGPAFAMAPELWAWFHGDANTLSFTLYNFGRGNADSHRRFAQAFLALPAIKATIVDQGDKDVRVRVYPSANGIYVGVAYKGYRDKKLTIRVPAGKSGAVLQSLVTEATVPAQKVGTDLQFEVNSGPMELNAFLIH